MQPKTHYTLVGIFVVILSMSLVYFICWLALSGDKHSYKKYLVYMNESVSGLNVDAAVKFNGVEVGSVKNIVLNPHDTNQVELTLQIQKEIPIRQDVTATLETQGITGLAYIGLQGGSPNTPLLLAVGQQAYPVILAKPSLFFRLDTALNKLTGNLDTITMGIESVFTAKNQQAFSDMLTHIDSFTSNLDRNSVKITAIIDNLDEIVSHINQASSNLPLLLQQASKMVESLNSAGNAVTQVMQQGKSQLTNLTEQAGPSLLISLQNLASITQQLRELSHQLQANPTVLLQGQSVQPAPGE